MKLFNRYALLSTVGGLAALLAACGGGGGGGGGGGSTYTINGTVTGLTTSGLMLENNGGGSQSISANATTFQYTGLANGAAYAISIQAQPSGETCGITNGGGTISGANVSNVTVSCSNAVAVSVNPGPASSGNQTFNDLLVSVIVCPSTGRNGCVTINNVLVDTGSEGLRLMKSVVTNAGLTLTPLADPNNNANTIHECYQFADGYTWGAIAMAGVQIGGESVNSIPVQVIDDSTTPSPAAPAACTSNGASLSSVNAFDANGILGVGMFVQDCGTACANYYFSCTSGGSCTATTPEASDQVVNPVASFATDNNGVELQLASIPDTGMPTASGTLTFGIGTESNNALNGSAVILTANANGYFQTTPSGQMSLTNSFLDSGSNALFFPSSSLPVCADATSFYCPAPSSSLSLTTVSATNQGANGNTDNVQFGIANLDFLSANDSSNFALDDVGGPGGNFTNVTNFFDWGLPFFYGRTVYIAIDGKSAGGTTGPYYGYTP
jgi:hypothetical protein